MRSHTDRRQVTATALARAYLAGEWDPPAMGRRAKRAMGDRRRWLVDLAHVVRHQFPDRPVDRPTELAEFISVCTLFERALDDPDRPLLVHVWMTAPAEMPATRWAVPSIADLGALADWLGVSTGHLAWFADRRSIERTARTEQLRHYHRRWARKADGSIRLLEAPKRELKDLQRQVLRQILDRIPSHAAAHGFRPGHSVVTAAQPHCGREVVIRLDLESFFSTVTAGRIYGIFRLAGYHDEVAHALAALCTTTTPLAVLRAAPGTSRPLIERRRRLLRHLAAPHLAQGSPSSPALANLSAFGLDRRLAGLANRIGGSYTRYADDLVVSGDEVLRRSSRAIVRLVGEIACEEGFRVHEAKTRVRTAAQRQTVTGLVVNDHPNVARPEYDRLRALLHEAAQAGPEAANRRGHPDFRSHVRGRVTWVGGTNERRIEKLQRAFASIDWQT